MKRGIQPETVVDVAWWLLIAAVIALLANIASAQAPDWQRERLALELAVVAAHEGALANVEDTDLIFQVVETRARTLEAQREFLYAHSPRALGRKPCKAGGNCEWSSQLLKRPNAAPSGFKPGWWAKARAAQWALVRDRARALVYGTRTERPCYGSPYSWGFAGDLESAYHERGLVPLGCEGTMNDGFAFAPRRVERTVPARRARGDFRSKL